MKEIKYFIFNGFFAYSVYAGLFLNQKGFLNIAVFIGWMCVVGSFFFHNKETIKAGAERITNPPFPIWVDVSFDFCITAAFIYHGYIFLPIFYLIHMGNLMYGRLEAEKIIESKITKKETK